MVGYHVPVLLSESVDLLVTDPGGTYLDATFGGGGHSALILSRLNQHGRVVAFDVDEDAAGEAGKLSSSDPRLTFYRENYSSMSSVLERENIRSISGALFDLGVSSHQIDSEEGISYRRDEKLDMRLDKRLEKSAADVVGTYDYDRLVELFREYAEEPRSRALARAIVNRRKTARIETTAHLADVVAGVCGRSPRTLSRIFQALRIEVNNELGALAGGLDCAIQMTARGGRIAAISYHSLEDRIVKEKFKYEASSCVCPPEAIVCSCGKVARLRILTRKPVTPDSAEIRTNRRSRSAKLRVAEKIV